MLNLYIEFLKTFRFICLKKIDEKHKSFKYNQFAELELMQLLWDPFHSFLSHRPRRPSDEKIQKPIRHVKN